MDGSSLTTRDYRTQSPRHRGHSLPPWHPGRPQIPAKGLILLFNSFSNDVDTGHLSDEHTHSLRAARMGNTGDNSEMMTTCCKCRISPLSRITMSRSDYSLRDASARRVSRQRATGRLQLAAPPQSGSAFNKWSHLWPMSVKYFGSSIESHLLLKVSKISRGGIELAAAVALQCADC